MNNQQGDKWSVMVKWIFGTTVDGFAGRARYFHPLPQFKPVRQCARAVNPLAYPNYYVAV